MDWTDDYNQKLIVENAIKLVDSILKDLHKKRSVIYSDLGFKEFSLLFYFPVFVAVNIFIERLLVVMNAAKKNVSLDILNIPGRWQYFKSTRGAILSYYHDPFINNSILHEMGLFLKVNVNLSGSKEGQFKTQDGLINGDHSAIKKLMRKIKYSFLFFLVKLCRPKVVGENSNWMRGILNPGRLLVFDYNKKIDKVNYKIRNQIKKCCMDVFAGFEKDFLGVFSPAQIIALSKLLAKMVDYILPLAVIEGFTDRYDYYKKMLVGWPISHLHSFTGYAWNENFKIFAFLAKRNGALLIYHAHGLIAPKPMPRLIYTEFQFLDYCFVWSGDNCDWMKADVGIPCNMLGLGSTYLGSIKKVQKRQIQSEEVIILYAASPLWRHNPILEEATQEKRKKHKIRVVEFLKQIIKNYPKARILYKPLWSSHSEPIYSYLAEEVRQGIIKIVSDPPLLLFDKVDIVLWDSVSTGFAESIQAGVPTLVFHPQEEYDRALPFGRCLFDKLKASGILFYDICAGINSIDKIMNNLAGFVKAGREPIKEFQKALARPISKKEFLHQMNKELT